MKTSTDQKRCCHYIGTEIRRSWWSRYRKPEFLPGGFGDFWLSDHAFHFQRFREETPIRIDFDKIQLIRLGKWHARRWCSGAPVVKIDWEHEDTLLSTGFVFSRDGLETLGVMQKLEARAKKFKKPAFGALHPEPAA